MGKARGDIEVGRRQGVLGEVKRIVALEMGSRAEGSGGDVEARGNKVMETECEGSGGGGMDGGKWR